MVLLRHLVETVRIHYAFLKQSFYDLLRGKGSSYSIKTVIYDRNNVRLRKEEK